MTPVSIRRETGWKVSNQKSATVLDVLGYNLLICAKRGGGGGEKKIYSRGFLLLNGDNFRLRNFYYQTKSTSPLPEDKGMFIIH